MLQFLLLGSIHVRSSHKSIPFYTHMIYNYTSTMPYIHVRVASLSVGTKLDGS